MLMLKPFGFFFFLVFFPSGYSQRRHHTVPATTRQVVGVRRTHQSTDRHRHRLSMRYTDRKHRQSRPAFGHVSIDVLRVRQFSVRLADAVAHAELETSV